MAFIFGLTLGIPVGNPEFALQAEAAPPASGNLPAVYFINLVNMVGRRSLMEKTLAKVPTRSTTRVEAVTSFDVIRDVALGSLHLGADVHLRDLAPALATWTCRG